MLQIISAYKNTNYTKKYTWCLLYYISYTSYYIEHVFIKNKNNELILSLLGESSQATSEVAQRDF